MLCSINKPGRYIGRELNSQEKDLSRVDASIVLAYPDVYDIGMSYYGFQILYHILNRDHQIAAERVYTPWPDFEDKLRKTNIPLFSLESKTSIRKFDIIGFTLPYELTFTNILNMLDLARIPIFADQRSKDDPIVIAGGGGAYNPEPLAPFIDLFVIGDAEETIVAIVKFIGAARRKKMPRMEILKELAFRFAGIYVPILYEVEKGNNRYAHIPQPLFKDIPKRVKALRVSELLPHFYPDYPIIPLIGITQDRLVIEIMRGCTKGCRFCQAGIIHRPVRERPANDVAKQIVTSLKNTGYDEISLLSLSTSDYTGLNEVVSRISEPLRSQHISISFPSLRPDSFTEHIAKIAAENRKSGLTFAPESGSSRLRCAINKQITDKEILESTEIALRNGWRQIKLYFMLGLPTETDLDIDDIVTLTKEIVNLGKGKLTINITLSNFIPKPFTPFQWENQNSVDTIQSKIDRIKPQLRAFRKIKVMSRNPYYSHIEGIISRGDRHVGTAIREAWNRGAKFDAWRDCFDPNTWETAFKTTGVDKDKYLSGRDKNKPLQWEIIDPLVKRESLIKECQKAFAEKTTPDCRIKCTDCGVCDTDDLKMKLDEQPTASIPVSCITKTEEKLRPVRYRLKYRKGTEARFTSHLDMLRIFNHAIRRSGAKMIFTQGYNKKPKISSGPPLPLGYTSDEDYIELLLKTPFPDICDRINQYLPDGIKVIKYIKVPHHAPSIFSSVNGLEYQVEFTKNIPEETNRRLQNILSMPEIIVNRKKGNICKKINIRPFIKSLKWVKPKLYIQLKVMNEQTARVRELMELLNVDNSHYIVHRSRTHLTSRNIF